MATTAILLLLTCSRLQADLYRVAPLDNSSYVSLHDGVCYVKNAANTRDRWCELIPGQPLLPSIKTCVSNNGNLPILDDPTNISDWLDRSIATTNCSYYLLSSMSTAQKRTLTIVQSVLLVILFVPLLFELVLVGIRRIL